MRALLPLAVLVLAACDPPLEHLYPARYYDFERDGIEYDVRAQYDPFARSWFTRVISIERPLELDDAEFATRLVEVELGPQLCEGNVLAVEPGELWNPLAGNRTAYLATHGAWHLVGQCTDIPVASVLPVMSANSPWMMQRRNPGTSDTVVVTVPEEAEVTVIVDN